MSDLVGTTLGRYRILRRIGSGGMGSVFEAEDRELQRPVALKFLSEQLLDDTDSKQRFRQEALAIAALDHPNICTIHEVGETESGRPFFVMAYYDSGTLKSRMADGPLALDQALDFALQVAGGLAFAHESGVFHRDIKPANLLLTPRDEIKIVDFGLAKLATAYAMTEAGTIRGTPGYMAPEQALGQSAGGQADVWGLGVVLYEMVSGRKPFAADNPLALLSAIIHGEVTPLAAVAPGLPDDLQRILDRSLAKKPADRYPSMAEMAADLQALSGGGRVRAPRQRPAGPSVAVLSFEDMSPDRDQAYFCEGIAEELISALGRVEGLTVAARSSSFQFKDRNPDIRAVGEALGVASVLEGSLRKSGNKIRVTAHLVGVADGFEMWSDRYDRQLDDVFEIQDDIASRVVLELKKRLTGGDSTEDETLLLPHVVRPANPEVYSLYLRGRHAWNKRTPADLERAVHLFGEATENDPGYAPAWAGLADAYVTLAIYGARSPHEVMPLARAAAAKSATLDGGLAEAYAALGCVEALFDWDWKKAESHFRRAVDLRPSYATGYQWLGINCLAPQGRLDEALVALERAAELDPVAGAIGVSMAWVLHLAGRFEAADRRLAAVLEVDPDFAMARFFRGRNHAAQEAWEPAVAELERARALSGGSAEVDSALGYTCARAGQRARAEEILAGLREWSGYVSPCLLAQVLTGLGDREQAIAELERAAEGRAADLVWLAVAPAWEPLRHEPRVAALLTAAGL